MARILIDSLDDSRLDAYRDLKSHRLRQRSSSFVAEGANVVRRLLGGGFEVQSALASDRCVDMLEGEIPAGIPLYVVPHRLASELVGFKFHAGVLACGLRKPNPTLSEIADPPGRASILAACAHIVDPENTGGVIRACAAFGAGGLLLGEGCADPFSRRVLRVSMGNAFRLPIRECSVLGEDLALLKADYGYELIATVLDDGAEPLHKASRPCRAVVLFGNEAQGLPPELVRVCDRRVTIPMQGADSLNVAVAAAVCLYQFMTGTPAML
jgi:tRNA G18 (ribose-2'-O)-methylase SpoU